MIRQATKEDIPSIMQIVKDSIQIMHEQGNDQWGEQYPLAKHYDADIQEGNLYVFEEEGKVLGVACICNYGHHEYDEIAWLYDGPYYCIKRLAVDPKERKKGIALKFYEKAEDIALENGVHLIRTDTYSKNKGAVELFKKANYRFVQERINSGRDEPFYYFEKRF